MSLKVSTFIDMTERQPIPIPKPQHSTHEGGNGVPGLPPTLQERTKPPPENSQGSPPVENPSLKKRSGAVFDCVVPNFFDGAGLYLIRRLLSDKNLTLEDAKKLEQKWRETLKTIDRQTLEETLMESERQLEDDKESNKRGGLTALGQALIPAREKEVEVLRTELRQRFSDEDHN
jgi:hypothetical protein